MNDGLEGIHHNSIWPDESYPASEPVPPTFEASMDAAQNSLRKKIAELMRAREKRSRPDAGGDETAEGADSAQ
ncbi:MAG: hypothetical protein JXN59_02540 [Anaerolineae bacterium]|nr:hypothetical protein [Anaerolineae bacterium]